MKSLIFSRLSLLLTATVFAAAFTSCSSIRPAGGLGMMLNGEEAANPRPTQRDYMDMPPLRQDQARTMFRTNF